MDNTFSTRDKVVIGPGHWNPKRHGTAGTIYSLAQSAQGLPTAYVRLDTGGAEFVHLTDLTHNIHDLPTGAIR